MTATNSLRMAPGHTVNKKALVNSTVIGIDGVSVSLLMQRACIRVMVTVESRGFNTPCRTIFGRCRPLGVNQSNGPGHVKRTQVPGG